MVLYAKDQVLSIFPLGTIFNKIIKKKYIYNKIQLEAKECVQNYTSTSGLDKNDIRVKQQLGNEWIH